MALKIYDAYGRETQSVKARVSPPDRGGAVSQGTVMYDGQFLLDDPPDLKIRQKRYETFRKMAETDAYIAESLRANTLPLITQATWELKPSIEPEDPESLTPEEQDSEDQRELIAANLYNVESKNYTHKFGLRPGWTQRLSEILRMLRYGFALFHKTSHIVDGKRVFKKWTYLEPHTIVRWHTATVDGELTITKVERQYRKEDGTTVGAEFIDVSELMLYTWDLVGMHAQGVPLIRPMYGAWVRKEWILRAKMVAAQRAGVGVPWAARDPDQDGDDTKTTSDLIEDFLQSSLGKGTDQAYLSVANPSLKLGYMAQPPASLKVFDSLAAQEGLEIVHAGGTKLGMLGETPGGSRNVGEEQQALSYIMIKAIGEIVCGMEKDGCGPFKSPIFELIEWNYGEDVRRPTLHVSNVDPKESVMNIPVLLNAKAKGMVKARPVTEKMILDRLGFPVPKHILDSDPIEDHSGEMPIMGPGGGERNLNPERPGGGDRHRTADEPSKAGDKSPDDVSKARQMRIRFSIEDIIREPSFMPREVATDSGLRRTPTMFEERVLALGQIKTTLDQGGDRVASIAKQAHNHMIEEIIERGRAGKISRDSLAGFRRSNFKGSNRFTKKMVDAMLNMAAKGRNDAREEFDRQVALSTDETDFMLQIFKGAIPSGGRIPGDVAGIIPTAISSAPDPLQALIAEVAADVGITSATVIDQIWLKLVSETVGQLESLRGLELPDLWDAVETHLFDLSGSPLERVSRKGSSVGYNAGRDLFAKLMVIEDRASHGIRVEILDTASCGVCPGLDGQIMQIGSSEWEEYLPPSKCLGAGRCRGFVTVIAKELTDALN